MQTTQPRQMKNRPWPIGGFALALLGLLVTLAFWLGWTQSKPLHAQTERWVPLDGIVQVAAGNYHTCALSTPGGVKCWGANSSGQLGDGTVGPGANKGGPVDVVGLGSGVAAIATGAYHTCALSTTGGVKCWGHNVFGQLGDGTAGAGTDKSSPVDVVGLDSGVAAIAVGDEHTCVLTTAGGVKCWGWNGYRQLGDGSTVDKSSPVDVVGLGSGVAAIAAGGYHTCARTTAGGVKCWGRNGEGQLGDTTTASKSSPVDVVGLDSGVTAIAAGYRHTCALTTADGVKCWGYNVYGQLGDNTMGAGTDKSSPADVVGLDSGMAAIAAGVYHTCALATAGGVKCWGRNVYGQLGDGTLGNMRPTPVDVAGLGSNLATVATGSEHTCALTTAGGVKCWGGNNYGQLGDGTTASKSSPADVVGLGSSVAVISAGWNHTCVLTTVGGVKCWGWNISGQLGDSTMGAGTDKSSPVDVVGLSSGAVAIAAGNRHTCTLTAGGGVKCWGWNVVGQLGDGSTGPGTDKSSPVDVVGLSSNVVAIATGGGHTCALTTAGGVKCWGNNGDGQLGDGTKVGKSSSVDVGGLSSGVTAIATGENYTCALTTAGGVKCWGSNSAGELGDGTSGAGTEKSSPVDVVGLDSGVTAIAAGSRHTCALTTAGAVKCWGENVVGQLGDGTMGTGTAKSSPVDVVGLGSGVVAIAANQAHTCALTIAGGVKCWGSNTYGQLGDNTQAESSSPMTMGSLSSGVAAIAVGFTHTCALITADGVKCWGQNSYGQVGDGTAWRTTPVDVLVEAIPVINSENCHYYEYVANPLGWFSAKIDAESRQYAGVAGHL